MFGSIAYASIPDSSGLIRGCYTNQTFNGVHAIGVLDTATNPTCPKNTTAISWNQQGPPGTSGIELVTRSTHVDGVIGAGTFQTIGPLYCPSGKHAINGGLASLLSDQAWFDAQASNPTANGINPAVSIIFGQGTSPASGFQGNNGIRNPVLPTTGQTAAGTGWTFVVSIQFPTFPATLHSPPDVAYGVTLNFWLACA
jgi:hypothetical protein